MADSTRPREDAEALSRQLAKDERNKRRRELYAHNRSKILLRLKQNRQADPEKARARDAENRRRHREKRNARNREYMREDRQKNPKKYRDRALASQRKNPEAHRRRCARYYKKHKDRAQAASNRYQEKRRKEDPVYALCVRMRNRLSKALSAKTAAKVASTIQLVGCSPQHLAMHIEAQFLPGMSWANRSEWHIDHIIPVAKFDLSEEEQQRAAFHYTNLRPLWAIDNHKKSDKVPGQQLFGFAYAAKIAEGDRPRLRRQAKNGTRQHVNDKHRSV